LPDHAALSEQVPGIRRRPTGQRCAVAVRPPPARSRRPVVLVHPQRLEATSCVGRLPLGDQIRGLAAAFRGPVGLAVVPKLRDRGAAEQNACQRLFDSPRAHAPRRAVDRLDDHEPLNEPTDRAKSALVALLLRLAPVLHLEVAAPSKARLETPPLGPRARAGRRSDGEERGHVLTTVAVLAARPPRPVVLLLADKACRWAKIRPSKPWMLPVSRCGARRGFCAVRHR